MTCAAGSCSWPHVCPLDGVCWRHLNQERDKARAEKDRAYVAAQAKPKRQRRTK